MSVGEQTEGELTAFLGMCPFSHLAATPQAQLLREAFPDCPSAQPSLHWPLCLLCNSTGWPGLLLLVRPCLPHLV